MKIQATQNQMTIDNPLGLFVTVGAILVVVGIAAAGYGLIGHNQTVTMVGAGVTVLGALIVISARSTHLVLDKAGPSSLSSKTIFSKTTTQSFVLSDVTTVLLEARESSETTKNADGTTSDQTRITSNLFLVTKTAQRIPVGTATKIMNIGGLVGSLITTLPLKEEADQIAAFIGVTVQASDSVGPINSLL
ncbi:MAG TPA: hypothetical protein VK753_07195 [Xanthomonadaceae bacterium]|jgi:hypothetical protein|nr:hypothetical protein [Xanthomonadaceae bacterium]